MNKPMYTAQGAVLVGDITFGKECSVYYNAVIRADEAPIEIGDRVNIQDLCLLHVSPGTPMHIGNNVTVGHGAILHSCTIDDNVLIGMGSIILNNAHIPNNCIVGAGALVTQGKTFPEGSMILGSPAKAVRPLSDEEIAGIRKTADKYVEWSAESAKNK